MFFGKREDKVEKLFFKHFDAVEETLTLSLRVIEGFLDGDPDFAPRGKLVHEAEDEADSIRRDIVTHLFEGAFIPVFREDFKKLAELVDNVANKAESVVDEIVLTRPHIPDELQDDMFELAKTTVTGFFELRKALNALYSKRKKVMECVKGVSKIEAEVDKLEWQILEKAFASDLDLAKKLHLRDLVKSIGSIADRMENAGDHMALMVVKRQF